MVRITLDQSCGGGARRPPRQATGGEHAGVLVLRRLQVDEPRRCHALLQVPRPQGSSDDGHHARARPRGSPDSRPGRGSPPHRLDAHAKPQVHLRLEAGLHSRRPDVHHHRPICHGADHRGGRTPVPGDQVDQIRTGFTRPPDRGCLPGRRTGSVRVDDRHHCRSQCLPVPDVDELPGSRCGDAAVRSDPLGTVVDRDLPLAAVGRHAAQPRLLPPCRRALPGVRADTRSSHRSGRAGHLGFPDNPVDSDIAVGVRRPRWSDYRHRQAKAFAPGPQ